MARETVEKDIDGEVYTFYQMDPMTSVVILTKILRIIATPVGKATEQIAKSGIDNIVDADVEEIVGKMNIGSIIGSLCDRLDENEVRQIIIAMLEQVHHKGKGEVSKCFNTHFKGRISHLLKVVGAAMEVEYADFFGEGSVVQDFLKRAAINLPEQK